MTRTTNARIAGFTYLFYAAIGICIELLMHHARGVDGDSAELAHVAKDCYSELGEEKLGKSTGGDTKRGLAGTCAFEYLANAGLIIDRAGEIDVAASRRRRLAQSFELGVLVQQPDRERASGRDAVVDARLDDDAVGLDLLALAAPVASLSAFELAVDRPRIKRDARGKTFDDRRECRAV